MANNTADHQLNNIEVRGGDSDYQVVSLESGEQVLMEYVAANNEWRVLGQVDLNGNAITNVSAVETDSLSIGESDALSSGDFVAWGPEFFINSDLSTTQSSSWVDVGPTRRFVWDSLIPDNAQIAIYGCVRLVTSAGDIKLRDVSQGSDLWRKDGVNGNVEEIQTYDPLSRTDTSIPTLQVRTDDGGTESLLKEGSYFQVGVQL